MMKFSKMSLFSVIALIFGITVAGCGGGGGGSSSGGGTGANNSKAKLIAIDHMTCTVEVDHDGDDIYEWNSGVIAWEEL